VCGTSKDVNARLPDLDVQYASFEDLDRVLPQARLTYTPQFAAPESNDQFLGHLQWLAEDDATRLLYVALTRAREKLVLEWPEYLADKDKVTYWSVLREKAGLERRSDVLAADGFEMECRVRLVDKMPLTLAADDDTGAVEQPVLFRQAIQAGTWVGVMTPEAVAPSNLGAAGTSSSLAVHREQVAPMLELGLEVDGAVRGELLHRWFEILAGNPGRRELLGPATGYPLAAPQLDAIGQSAVAFEGWLTKKLQAREIGREVPVLALDGNGSVVAGLVDVLVKTDRGDWVVDYKSDEVDDRDTRFQTYLPQLLAYAQALNAAGDAERVQGVAIFWLHSGEVSWAAMNDSKAE